VAVAVPITARWCAKPRKIWSESGEVRELTLHDECSLLYTSPNASLQQDYSLKRRKLGMLARKSCKFCCTQVSLVLVYGLHGSTPQFHILVRQCLMYRSPIMDMCTRSASSSIFRNLTLPGCRLLDRPAIRRGIHSVVSVGRYAPSVFHKKDWLGYGPHHSAPHTGVEFICQISIDPD
jgi:hypothetical protein